MSDPSTPDTYQIDLGEAREDDSVWTDFETVVGACGSVSANGDPVWGAYCPQPDCSELQQFEGEPEDFANRPYACTECNWISLMHASVTGIEVNDDGLRADGGPEQTDSEQYEKGDPCPECGGETAVVEGTWYSCAECEWVKRYRGIGA